MLTTPSSSYHKPLPRQIHHYSDMGSVVFGIFFNITLLVIVKRNKEKGLRSFGQVVFMNCILDLYLTFTTLIGEIEVDTRSGVIFFFCNSFLAPYIPHFYHYLLVYFFCIGIGFSVFYAPLPFYHRYMLIVHGTVLSHKHIFMALLIPMFFSLWITAWQLCAMIQADSRRDELAQMINSTLWNNEDGSIPMFAAFPVDSVPSIIYLSNCIVCFPLSYALPFYLFYKIYQTSFANRENMSERTIKLNRSLNRALISQALFPFLLGGLPVTFVMSMLIFRFDFPLVGIIATGSISWIPAVNPFLTMLLIPAYYRAILPKKIQKKIASLRDSSATPVERLQRKVSVSISQVPHSMM